MDNVTINPLPGKNSRIDVVDALRGFAVMAILLVHSLEHFIFPVYPTSSPAWLNALDQGVFTVVFTLFAGKAYAIFALLFGFTFYIQHENQRKRGKDFGFRFLWRLLLLILFAAINAAFFPAGDVLLLFVVVGLVLFFMRNRSEKTVLITAVFFLLQPAEWYHFFSAWINPAHTLPDFKVGEMYAEVAAYTKSGHFGDFILGNITLGQKASFLWAVNAGRLFQTAGLFLLGFYVGKKQFFVDTEKNAKFWTGTLIGSAIAFAPLSALKELVSGGDGIASQSAGNALGLWQNLTFMLVLVASFVLLYRVKFFSDAVSSLRFYGKMSLTNYISQSVLGALVYFPFGLSLAPHCGYSLSLLIGFAMFLLQVKFCKWWLEKHKQGPLESLWHKWTWLGTKK